MMSLIFTGITRHHRTSPLPAFKAGVGSSRIYRPNNTYLHALNFKMEKEILDYVLVPLGLLIMLAYHLWLLQRILKHPNHTVIGINSINRRLWVLARMEVN